MLVLTRKVGETIDIGGGIEVTVLSTHRSRVRLGLAAPQGVTIRRREIDCRSLPSAQEEREEHRDV